MKRGRWMGYYGVTTVLGVNSTLGAMATGRSNIRPRGSPATMWE